MSDPFDVTQPAFTPTQQRLLAVMADGKPHSDDELLRVIDPGGQAEFYSLYQQVRNMRMRMECSKCGHWIVREVDQGNKKYFRHVILLNHQNGLLVNNS
ncbi:MAG: hypothetical protein KGL39_32640 [Patescibacteria group bacterium]|nr:hypothetical protein [Patescibacteria group bacterium]